MNKECRQVRRLIGPYADNELDQSGRDKVEQHLKSCADCRNELAAIQALGKLVMEHGAPRLNEEWLEQHRFRVLHRLRMKERLEQGVRGPAPIPWFRLATVAAGMVVVLIVVFAGWRILSRTGLKPAGPVHPIELAARDETGQTAKAVREAESQGAPARADQEKKVGAVTYGEQPRAAAAPAPVTEAESEVMLADRLAAPEEGGIKRAAVAASSTRVEEFAGCDSMPVLVSWPELKAAVPLDTGTVVLRLLVEPDSSVSRVFVERSSGSDVLDSIAVEMAQDARFRPGIRKGKLVRSWLQLPYRFQAEK